MTMAVQKQVFMKANPKSMKIPLPTFCSSHPLLKNNLKKDKFPVKPLAISRLIFGMIPIMMGKKISFGDFFRIIKTKKGIKYKTEEISKLS